MPILVNFCGQNVTTLGIHFNTSQWLYICPIIDIPIVVYWIERLEIISCFSRIWVCVSSCNKSSWSVTNTPIDPHSINHGCRISSLCSFKYYSELICIAGYWSYRRNTDNLKHYKLLCCVRPIRRYCCVDVDRPSPPSLVLISWIRHNISEKVWLWYEL